MRKSFCLRHNLTRTLGNQQPGKHALYICFKIIKEKKAFKNKNEVTMVQALKMELVAIMDVV